MKRVLALLCSLTVLCAALLVGVPTAQAAVDGTVRVWLKSMNEYGTIQSVSITLDGSYSIPTAPEVSLSTRGTYYIENVDGTLMISGTGIDGQVAVGTKFTVKQHKNDDGSIGTISLYNNRYGNRSYRGDMLFEIYNGSLRLINYVYIEDYLYGVLAGELSNTFPLETLKAQAIIARSYVYNRMLTNEPNYEIGDTSSDQVYKGYNSANTNIIRAVDETAGILLQYGSKYVNAYFGASNGGQVELPGNAWSSSSSEGCYVMKDDPYDVRNPSSRSVTYTFTTDPDSLDTSFYVLIQDKVYQELGYYPNIAGIQDVWLSDPVETDERSRGISRNYQTMNMTVTVRESGWSNSDDSNVYDPFAPSDSDSGSVETVDISIDLHNELKWILFSADSDLRLFSLEEDGNYYYLTLARYGHGVDMSQRGAQQMAKEGHDYEDIIYFYFNDVSLPKIDFVREELTTNVPISDSPIATATVTASSLTVRADASTSASKLGSLSRGTVVNVYAELDGWLCIVYNGSIGYISTDYVTLSDYSESGGSTTPGTGGDDALYRAQVTLSTASSTLKLRESGSSSADVLTYMPHGTIVEVLSDSGSWYQVRTLGGTVGYCSAQYLTRLDDEITTTTTPTETSGQSDPDAVAATGEVTGSSVNVRSGPSTSASVLGSLKKGDGVEIISQNNGFYRIVYNSGTAYISSSYVRVTGTVATPTPTADPDDEDGDAVAAMGEVTGSSVNVRSGPSTSASVLGSLKKGDGVEIISQNGDFYRIVYDGDTAYISASYVRVTGTVATSTPRPTATPDSGSSSGDLEEGEALIADSGTALMGDLSGSVIYEYLSKNDVVTILDTEGSYYLVRTEDGETGYVAKSAVKAAATATPSPTETPESGGSATRQGTIKLSSSSSNLNLRQGPSTSTDVLATLRHGQSVTVTGESGDWYAIEVSGYSGYVMKTYVTFSEDEESSSGSSGVFPAVIRLSSSSSTVNVRSGAGTNYSKIGSLTNGASVNVVASNGDWYRIEYGNGYGYVMKTYVQLVSSGSSGSSSGDEDVLTAVTTAAVNLREEGTTSSDKLGTYPKGTRVVVLEKGSSWSRVDISGNEGYMKNTYLDFND